MIGLNKRSLLLNVKTFDYMIIDASDNTLPVVGTVEYSDINLLSLNLDLRLLRNHV